MLTAIETKLMTADEFFDWANLPENEDRLFELEDGKVIEMPRPVDIHGVLCAWVTYLLCAYVDKVGKGLVMSNDTGLLVRKKPDTLRGPDVMFFREALQLTKRYVIEIPDLVVEVMSPSDRPGRTNKRMQQYIKRGIPLIWQVDPDDRLITVYRGEELSKTFDETDMLTGNGILPGFKCPVSNIFKKI